LTGRPLHGACGRLLTGSTNLAQPRAAEEFIIEQEEKHLGIAQKYARTGNTIEDC
jgi:hypothetical protein